MRKFTSSARSETNLGNGLPVAAGVATDFAWVFTGAAKVEIDKRPIKTMEKQGRINLTIAFMIQILTRFLKGARHLFFLNYRSYHKVKFYDLQLYIYFYLI